MGCYQGREEGRPPGFLKRFKPRGRHIEEYKFDCLSNQDTLILVDIEKNLNDPHSEFQIDQILSHLDNCKEANDWEEICKFTSCSVAINLMNSWAETPRSISSLAILLLIGKTREDPHCTAPLIGGILPHLLDAIRTGTEDLRGNALMLLCEYAPYAGEYSVVRLLELNALKVLVERLGDSKVEINLAAAAVCSILYKRRPDAQSEFFAAGGHEKLLGVLDCSVVQETGITSILSCIRDLITDEDGEVKEMSVTRFQSNNAVELLGSINSEGMSNEAKEQIERLLLVLRG